MRSLQQQSSTRKNPPIGPRAGAIRLSSPIAIVVLFFALVAMSSPGWAQATTGVPAVTMAPGVAPTLAPADAPESGGMPSATGITPAPPPSGAPGNALGSIHLNLAAPLQTNDSAHTTCTATVDSIDATDDFPIDMTDASASAAPTCGLSSPPPTPGLVSPPVYGSGVVPLDATEAGTSGLSPLITLPIPSATPACSDGPADTAAPAMTEAFPGTTVPAGC